MLLHHRFYYVLGIPLLASTNINYLSSATVSRLTYVEDVRVWTDVL